MRVTLVESIGLAAACGAAGFFVNDWIAAAAVLVLYLIWKLLDTGDHLYILPLAMTFQWTQTSIGVFYVGLLGRHLIAVDESDYRPMVLIGLGCCLAMTFGLALGMRLIKRPDASEDRPGLAFSTSALVGVYIATVIAEGSMNAAIESYPSLRQIIVTIDAARLGILFLILRRLCQPKLRLTLLLPVVGMEVVLGITGFFAGFRDPIVLAGIALLEIFDNRNIRHWLAMIGAGAAAVSLGILWIGIRGSYRADFIQLDNFENSRQARIDRVSGLSTDFLRSDGENLWTTTDAFVDRMWPIYYPALAIKRVPDSLPHTDGSMWMAAVMHVLTPRVFFPNKPELQSNSDLVRKYSNVMVAGREQNTSIAFGYAAESYIDFGIPGMFLPIFAYALVIGLSYSWFQKAIWHRELFVGYATVAYWLTLYLFERDLPTTLGVALGFIVYIGMPTVLLDRFLLVKYAQKQRDAADALFLSSSEHSHI
jgi:hypothetical protein